MHFPSASILLIVSALLFPSNSWSETGNTRSSDFHYEKYFVEVLGSRMAYVESGEGSPIVFLHGNPTSSYLWRNILPYAEGKGRLIAPDLIGMGDSAKLPPSTDDGEDGRYRFVNHRRYLDAFLEAVDATQNVTFVIHDWGSALGFDWMRRHPDQIRGVVYMESFLGPMTHSDYGFMGGVTFRALRWNWLGNWMVLEHNIFIEEFVDHLSSYLEPSLSEAEATAYRAPYLGDDEEDRRVTLTWPREIPFDGSPEDTYAILKAYSDWLPTTTEIPKLLIVAEPGLMVRGRHLEFARSLPNQEEVTVSGMHYIQESSPHEIGQALESFLDEL